MKNKIISAIGLVIIAACLAACASNKVEEKKENPYKKRATDIVQNSSFEISSSIPSELNLK
ncbi:MAG: hypothetical protein K5930_05550 [Treponemataceae bacterium]|nr:hypothetical protein [Treponemataceae bacterium]